MEYVSFSEAFRALLGQSGKSKVELSREMGVSESTLSKWEKGERFPQQGSHVIALEEALGVTDHTLFQLWTARAKGQIVTDEQRELFNRIFEQLEEINMKLDDLLARGD